MATAAAQMEKIVDFNPEALGAPFALRCAALLIDYMVLLAVPVGWLFLSKLVFDGGSGKSLSSTVWLFGVILFLINFLALPLFRGQTIGKMLTGLNIVKTDGTSVGLGRLLLRNVIGYLATGLTLGLGFFISAVNTTGRSLHDYIAGTIVVRGRKTQA